MTEKATLLVKIREEEYFGARDLISSLAAEQRRNEIGIGNTFLSCLIGFLDFKMRFLRVLENNYCF